MTQSRVALVTGGAYGIGRGIVQEFVGKGDAVVIADLRCRAWSGAGILDRCSVGGRLCLLGPTFGSRARSRP